MEGAQKKPKVLIVEDEAIVAQELADTLSRDYDIIGPVSSGNQAITLAKNERPDIVLMDVRIEGDLNGIETAIVIQGHYEESIPVVFLTALPSRQFPVLTVVEPFIYVNKPIFEHDLFSALERARAKKKSG